MRKVIKINVVVGKQKCWNIRTNEHFNFKMYICRFTNKCVIHFKNSINKNLIENCL